MCSDLCPPKFKQFRPQWTWPQGLQVKVNCGTNCGSFFLYFFHIHKFGPNETAVNPTFNLWPSKYHQFILELEWTFEERWKKNPSKRLHSQEWPDVHTLDRWTAKKIIKNKQKRIFSWSPLFYNMTYTFKLSESHWAFFLNFSMAASWGVTANNFSFDVPYCYFSHNSNWQKSVGICIFFELFCLIIQMFPHRWKLDEPCLERSLPK